MKRRSFFKSLARAAAIVALAPQIAFRVRPGLDLTPQKVATGYVAYWMHTAMGTRCVDDMYLKALAGRSFGLYDFLLDQQGEPNAYRAWLENRPAVEPAQV